MSFKKDYSNAGFADRFKIGFKDQIQLQMKVCIESVSSNEIKLIRPAIIAFQLLITPKISDSIYIENIEFLTKKWETEYNIKYEKYLNEVKAASCPDVIDKPIKDMPIDYMLAIYSACQALFERKKLLLEQEREERL